MKLTMYNMDVMQALSRISSDSVDCIVTSPPYWGLRNYGKEAETEWIDGWKGQLGLEPDYKLYLKHILQITAELKRVLKPTGTLWWNHGQTYSGSMQGYGATRDSATGIQHAPSQVKFYGASAGKPPMAKVEGMSAKCLMMLPERLAIKMVDEQGWIVRNDIVWHKPNHMPSSVKDRLAISWEHVYLFVKNKRYYFNLDAIREKQAESSIKRMQSFIKNGEKYDSNKHKTDKGGGHQNPYQILQNASHSFNQHSPLEANYDEKHYQRKIDKAIAESLNSPRARELRDGYNSKFAPELTGQMLQGFQRNNTIFQERQQSYIDAKRMFPDDEQAQNEYIKQIHDHNTPNILGKNPGDVWKINTYPYSQAHFATFPPDLPLRCIKAGCPNEVCSTCGNPKVAVVKITRPEGYEQSLKETSKYEGQIIRSKDIANGKPGASCSCNAPFKSGIILDPFAGSGTTLKVALDQGLDAIGIEINPKYIPLIERRTNAMEMQKMGSLEYVLNVK